MTRNSKTDQTIDKNEIEEPIWHRQIDLLLAMHLKMATCITYQKLAEEAQITPPHRIHKLTLYLERLIKADVEQGEFIRASLVISKVRGLPAPGFFSLLDTLGFQIDDQKNWHDNYIKKAYTLFE